MELQIKNKFIELTHESKLTVVDFYATWCGPCKMLSPIIENVDAKIGDEVNIVKVNIDEFNDLASENHIQSVPTLVFFKSGKEIYRRSGFIDEVSLINLIKKHK